MTELLKPTRGGFLRPFGCGWFIREYLLGQGPYGSPVIDPDIGAPQRDIYHAYKTALIETIATDRATIQEEREAKRQKRPIDPDHIARLIELHLKRIPFKSSGCRYHSFVVYFSTLQRLNWVVFTNETEHSELQDYYAKGQPRKYYRLTPEGMNAPDSAWANPHAALYG